MAKNIKETLLVRLYFFVFGATIVGETVVTALIVSSLGGEVLNKLYMINGAMLFILPSLFYTRIDRANRGELLKRITVIALITVGVLFLLYATMQGRGSTKASLILLLFYPFSYLLKTLLFLTFWTVANDITDASESKKIFPEVAAFGFLGGLVGALISRALLVAMPAEGLLLFWGSLYGIAYVFSKYLTKEYYSALIPQESIGSGHHKGQSIEAIHTILSSQLLQHLSKLYFFTYISIFMLDYFFWMQCGLRFSGPDELTKFSYSFYMFYSIVTFIVLRRITPNVIAEKGVATAFSYLPKLLLLGGGSYILASLIPVISSFVLFGVLLFWQLVRIIAFENFFSPVYQMFFTSVDKEKRGRAKTAIEGIVKPFAIIISGVLLWVFEKQPLVQIGIAFAASLIMLLVARKLRDAFVRSLSHQHNKKTLGKMVKDVDESEEEHVVEILASFMLTDSFDMRKLAVDLLISMNRPASVLALKQILERDNSERLLKYISERVGKIDTEIVAPVISELLTKELDIRLIVLKSLAMYKRVDTDYIKLAHDFFNSDDEDKKIVGSLYLCQNIPATKQELYIRYLSNTMAQTKHPFHEEALRAAAVLEIYGWRSIFLDQITHLTLSTFKEVSNIFLKTLQDKELHKLLFVVADLPYNYRETFMHELMAIPPKTIHVLDKYIGHEATDYHYAIRLIRAMVYLRRLYPGDHKAFSHLPGILKFGKQVTREAYQVGAMYHKILETGQKYALRKNPTDLFEGALKDSLIDAADTLFNILVVTEGYPYLLASRDEFRLNNHEDRASLVEIVESTRSSDIKDLLVPLLEESDWETYRDVWMIHFLDSASNEVFFTSHDEWVVWCALYWHYDFLQEVRHEKAVKDVVESLTESDNIHIQAGAKAVASLWGGAMGSEDSFRILDTVLYLKQLPLFESVSAAKLVLLAEEAQLVEYLAEDVISREGDVANHMYLIKEGSISVFKGAHMEEKVATLYEREVYGEVGLFNKGIRSASAVARTNCKLYVISRPQLKKMVVRIPEIANNLLAVYGKKLRDSNDELYRLNKELHEGDDL